MWRPRLSSRPSSMQQHRVVTPPAAAGPMPDGPNPVPKRGRNEPFKKVQRVTMIKKKIFLSDVYKLNLQTSGILQCSSLPDKPDDSINDRICAKYSFRCGGGASMLLILNAA